MLALLGLRVLLQCRLRLGPGRLRGLYRVDVRLRNGSYHQLLADRDVVERVEKPRPELDRPHRPTSLEDDDPALPLQKSRREGRCQGAPARPGAEKAPLFQSTTRAASRPEPVKWDEPLKGRPLANCASTATITATSSIQQSSACSAAAAPEETQFFASAEPEPPLLGLALGGLAGGLRLPGAPVEMVVGEAGRLGDELPEPRVHAVDLAKADLLGKLGQLDHLRLAHPFHV